MRHQIEITDLFKEKHNDIYGSHCITIPFERFVVDPWPYIKKIEVLLKTNISRSVKKVLKKQGIPRKITGVEPQNLIKVKNFALKKGACSEAIEVLESISKKYEVEYDH